MMWIYRVVKKSMAKVDAAKLKQIANEMGYENGELILNATLELEELRNKVGRMKATIKKKQHIIDTVNHHNNRLSNDNRACKYALGAKFMEIKNLREALENITEIELDRLATDVWSEASQMKRIANKALEGDKQ